MPLILKSDFNQLLLLSNAHFQTIYPSLFRKIRGVNFRGCSGEPNRLIRSYHCGATEDLHTVVTHVVNKKRYSCISLVGFSVDGNLTLMYLGAKRHAVSPLIKNAAAVSVPCDLESSSGKLAKRSYRLYMKRFLKMFHDKIRIKMQIMPGKIDDADYHSIRTFEQFDNRYTAPIHWFLNAKDYYSKCSCKQFLADINIPSLMFDVFFRYHSVNVTLCKSRRRNHGTDKPGIW